MKTIQQLCRPKKAVLARADRTYALNLTDFFSQGLDAEAFFEENFVTDGMQQLLKVAFERFTAEGETALITLTQAMGGGKTHSMIALGLLGQHPELRKRVLEPLGIDSNQEPIKVIGFSGRQSDSKYGVWGELAEQLGKRDFFQEHYTPLRAPGETAWENLLKNEGPVMILLDELPPYLNNAASVAIGNSDLAQVTVTALSNLFVAASKKQLSNVFVVISDLKGTYEGGSQKLESANRAINDLYGESKRIARSLTPVQQNSDEVFHILRKRVFDAIPDSTEINEVAQAYGKEVEKAKQQQLTQASGAEVAARINETYPFHPSFRDLYARFKENPGFQQTRGFIRMVRELVATTFAEGAPPLYLLGPQDFDLNDSRTYNVFEEVNSSIVNSISHDIASKGSSQAEALDMASSDRNGNPFQETAKLIYFSSLANVPNATRGLNESDLVQYLCGPNIQVSDLRNRILSGLRSNCWYLHVDREGKYLFKETENIVARITGLVNSYDQGLADQQIRSELESIFQSKVGDVYGRLEVMPHLPEVQAIQDSVTLIVTRPVEKERISGKIQEHFENQIFRNRVLYLTGDTAGMESVSSAAKNLKAVRRVIEDMRADKILDSDANMKEARLHESTYNQNFLSALRETFTRVICPTGSGLYAKDIAMNFSANDFNFEEQIRNELLNIQKFTKDTESETFRKKLETRLFTSREMEWSEVKKRAAITPEWQWHHPKALDQFLDRMLTQKQYRRNGDFIDKGPFPPPKTSLIVTALGTPDENGVVQLRLEPVYGDKVYYEFAQDPTTASMEVQDFSHFETSQADVRFLCLDSSGKHETGEVVRWTNPPAVRYKTIAQAGKTLVDLRSIPGVKIYYTTDGSDPGNEGALFQEPFEVQSKVRVLAFARAGDVRGDTISFDIDPGGEEAPVDPRRPAVYSGKIQRGSTAECYDFLTALEKENGMLSGLVLNGKDLNDPLRDVNVRYSKMVLMTAQVVRENMGIIRKSLAADDLEFVMHVAQLRFPTGAAFSEFMEALLLSYDRADVNQAEN